MCNMMAKYSALCVVLFSACWAITSGCTTDESTVTCKSIEELHKLSTYKEFETVKIKSEDENSQAIPNDAFKGMNKLERLGFDIKVSHFAPHTLRGIEHPFRFYIRSGTLEELPLGFLDGVPVQRFMITNTHLKKLNPKMFKNTPLLEDTYLVRNKLTTIEADVFSNTNIVKLELSRNEIATIEDGAFTSMKNLKFLDLSQNKLTTFPAEKVFDSTNSLEVLHLSDNLLTSITRFPTLPTLRGLVLSRNAIATIESKSFENLKNLDGIFFFSNKLTSIPADTLPANMKVLGAGDNPWSCSYLAELQTWAKNGNVKLMCSDHDTAHCTLACV